MEGGGAPLKYVHTLQHTRTMFTKFRKEREKRPQVGRRVNQRQVTFDPWQTFVTRKTHKTIPDMCYSSFKYYNHTRL